MKKAEISTATLTLQVTAKLNGEDQRVLSSQLHALVDYAVNRGLITGETALEVEDLRWHTITGDKFTTSTGS